MSEWLGDGNEYRFFGKALMIHVHRPNEHSRWLLTCEDVRLLNVPLEDREIDQAINEAIDLVAKRVIWLSEAWKRDLKRFASAITLDLE
jgi:hypothetical protein